MRAIIEHDQGVGVVAHGAALVASEVVLEAPSADQVNDLPPELRRIRGTGDGHGTNLMQKHERLHEGGSTSVAGDPVLNSQVGFWGAIWFGIGIILWRASSHLQDEVDLFRLLCGAMALSGLAAAV